MNIFTWFHVGSFLKTDREETPSVQFFLEIHHDLDCSKELAGKQGNAYAQGRYCPLYKCYFIAYGFVV